MATTTHTMVVELSHKVVVLFMRWLFREATISFSLPALSPPHHQKSYEALHGTTYETADVYQCTCSRCCWCPNKNHNKELVISYTSSKSSLSGEGYLTVYQDCNIKNYVRWGSRLSYSMTLSFTYLRKFADVVWYSVLVALLWHCRPYRTRLRHSQLPNVFLIKKASPSSTTYYSLPFILFLAIFFRRLIKYWCYLLAHLTCICICRRRNEGGELLLPVSSIHRRPPELPLIIIGEGLFPGNMPSLRWPHPQPAAYIPRSRLPPRFR
jgi:hypothetical protein